MNRRAPATGYDFGNKRQYRRTVWSALRAEFPCGVSHAHALLMPSIEGREIDVAMSKGFRQQHLHVIDDNPAIVAHLKRRYPLINTYGVSVDEACRRIADKGIRLHAANFDLCGQVSKRLQETLRGIAQSRVFDLAVVAVTVLRGREHGAANAFVTESRPGYFKALAGDIPSFLTTSAPGDALSGLSDCDERRLLAVADGLAAGRADGATTAYHVSLRRSGVYRSTAGSQTMLWGVFGAHHYPCVCRSCTLAAVTAGVVRDADDFADWWRSRTGEDAATFLAGWRKRMSRFIGRAT